MNEFSYQQSNQQQPQQKSNLDTLGYAAKIAANTQQLPAPFPMYHYQAQQSRLPVIQPIETLSSQISDFIKKIYTLLDQQAPDSLIYWSKGGDSFIVKDPAQLAQAVLPSIFRHSNFASFVRQLNKYDFHKVKSSGQSQSWEFAHPNFKRGRTDLLCLVKRKNMKKRSQEDTPNSPSVEKDDPVQEEESNFSNDKSLQQLSQKVDQLSAQYDKLRQQYDHVNAQLVANRKLLASQDTMMQDLLSMRTQPGPLRQPATVGNSDMTLDGIPVSLVASMVSAGTISNLNQNSKQEDTPQQVVPTHKRQPSWAVAPRVLLVEDDPTCRTISSKLLQMMGCKFDVATDGLAAVNKMNLDHYDIVLMDIVMPNLDGVSATHHIRQFDRLTPIISMTSNTTEGDLKIYLKTGMTDVLAKPFSKSSLFDILARYCSHLSASSYALNIQNNPMLLDSNSLFSSLNGILKSGGSNVSLQINEINTDCSSDSDGSEMSERSAEIPSEDRQSKRQRQE